MVLRCIGYDGAAYRSQLLSNGSERYPVITLVLYFGMKPWNKAKSLQERLHIPEDWQPYVNDYHINLFEIAFLTPEQVEMFTSDFKIVADYFVQKRANQNYHPTATVIRHVDEVLKLMSVLTGDNRFEQGMNSLKRDGGVTMCEVLDKIEAKGMAKGRIMAYYDMGLPVSKIAEKVQLKEEEVLAIIDSYADEENL